MLTTNDTETTTATPLLDALRAAEEAAEAAKRTLLDCDHEPYERCEHALASEDADSALDAAREALRGSDEPREWTLWEEGVEYDAVTASSSAAALAIAKSNVDRANYPDDDDGPSSTLWIDVRVHCEDTDESESGTVTCEPDEPDCDDDEAHDWQSPLAIVGGCKESPGVHGHGGGVIITEVCMRCGCARVTDTWAQRRDTGEQGLRSVSYEERRYRAQVRALRSEP